GEYIPLRPILFFLNKLVVGLGDFVPGSGPRVMSGPNGRLGMVICFEVIFPDLVRQFVDRGADYMVTITNDAWFGRTSAPYQHFAMVVFRAVENRVPFARAANTGILGFIDAEGHILRTTDLFVESALSGEVRLGGQRTIWQKNLLERELKSWGDMERRLDDLRAMVELAESEHDASLEDELAAELVQAEQALTRLRVNLLLRGEMDANNAILSIHPGAGGTESQDWAEMLMRMYVRWAEKKGYKVETLDYLPGEQAGIKSVTLNIAGENAYGYLKAEAGVHRLVRISPFDA